MFAGLSRRRSVGLYHLHMGGPDGDAAACGALLAPRFEMRLRDMGARFVGSAGEADIMLVTGLLLARNLDAALRELAALPQPSAIIAVGDAAIDGGQWARLEMPGLAAYPLSHYVDIAFRVPGDPATPQEIVGMIGECAKGQ
jgi:Ni,Fe-hydrogenase III small subunit